jgi:hypothetical protein
LVHSSLPIFKIGIYIDVTNIAKSYREFAKTPLARTISCDSRVNCAAINEVNSMYPTKKPIFRECQLDGLEDMDGVANR